MTSSRRIAHVAVLVHDYDQAIDYYTQVLGFTLIEDSDRGEGRRWVLVAPTADNAMQLLLARASTPAQLERVGDQTGGRVFLFLHTDDFDRDHRRFLAGGVRFLEAPRVESYGTVAVFEDLYGNRWICCS